MSKARDIADSNLDGLTVDTSTLVVDSSNNRVGIGTTSPGESLEVAGNIFVNTSGNPSVTIKTSGAGNNPKLRFQAATNYWDLESIFSNSTDDLFFGYNGSTKVAISNAGIVGVNTTNPSSIGGSSKLVVNQGADGNSVFVRGGSTRQVQLGTTSTTGYINTDNTSGLALNVNGSERMRIDTSGNVGIGISSPDSLLHISEDTASTSTHSYTKLHIEDASHSAMQFSGSTGGEQWIWFADDTTSTPVGGITYYHGGPYMGFRVEGSERMRITSGGNIQIGSTNSGVAGSLDVSIGSTSTSGGITLFSPTNGTHSIGFADGTSGTDRYRGYVEYQHSNDALVFATAATERMRINSSGNVGIGTANPSQALTVSGAGARIYLTGANEDIDMDASSNGQIQIDGNGYDGAIALNTDGLQIYHNSNARGILFGTNETERVRISNDGELLVGRTSAAAASEQKGLVLSQFGYVYSARDGTSNQTHILFINNAAVNATAVGSIKTSGSSTSYNTSSDYRLKENVTGITDGIERVKQLNPSRFNFIIDADTTVDGFLAHEAATVVPEAITGEKDAVDEDGNPEYQGIDQAKLVPLLTAALQEAITKIEDLEARVATLEGN